MSQKPYERIYLSPHLDDAALSCGGLVYLERKADLPVLVVTVMAGDAPSDAIESPIVAELHAVGSWRPIPTRWLSAVPKTEKHWPS